MSEPIITSHDVLRARDAEIEALEERIRVLHGALLDAVEYLQDWGGYVDSYSREKYDFDGDLRRLRAALEAVK